MNDPYAVLGISRNASDDEVKKAYRNLARKYHPDNFSDETSAEMAKEKMQEINEAYDSIVNSRRGGANYGGSNSGSADFRDIRTYINSGRLDYAQELLDGVPVERRNAEWYYLNGVVLNNRGWFNDAYTSFATAYRMNPSNPEYRDAFQRAQRGRGGFGGGYRGAGMIGNDDAACNCCTNLICADCCCEMMGGDLISCC